MLYVNISDNPEQHFTILGTQFLMGDGTVGNISTLKNELDRFYLTISNQLSDSEWERIEKFILVNKDKYGKNEDWGKVVEKIEAVSKDSWNNLNSLSVFYLKIIISHRKKLPLLLKSIHPEVRSALADIGYRLDYLITDRDDSVRVAVAQQGYGLNILVKDLSESVRIAVAKQGYGLDILSKDRLVDVRKAVARQGYKPEIMIFDKSPSVRSIANDLLARANQPHELSSKNTFNN